MIPSGLAVTPNPHNYMRGSGSDTDCTRCGSADDFKAAREAARKVWLKDEARRKEQDRERKQRNARRLAIHRQAMRTFADMLEQAGAVIGEEHHAVAGGSIEFEYEGLTFKLGGNIWD